MSRHLLFAVSLLLALGLVLPDISSAALVAWWKLDEGSGLTCADAAGGHTLDLATTGPTWVTTGLAPVPSGTTAALDFGGDDDIAVATGYKGVTGAGPRSVAMWIKYDSATIPLSGNGCHMFSNGENNAGERFDIKIQQDSGGQAAEAGKVRFEIQTSYVIANTRVDDGAWHHIALTIEPAGTGLFDRTKIYVDGVLDGQDGAWSLQGATNVAINTSALNDVLLGDSVLATGDRDYNGLMDDVRYYDHTLTAQEVADLATGGPSNPPTVTNTPLGTVFTSGPVTVDPGVTIAAGTDPDITSATVSISPRPDAPNEILTVGAPGALTDSYDAASGILTLTGTATAGSYQAALRSVQYDNTATSPTAGIRTIEFVVQDAGGLLSDPSSKGVSIGGVSLGVQSWNLYK